MTKAMLFFGGKAFNSSVAASNPPAEPPMPTIGKLESLLSFTPLLSFDVFEVDFVLLAFAFAREAFFFAFRFDAMAICHVSCGWPAKQAWNARDFT